MLRSILIFLVAVFSASTAFAQAAAPDSALPAGIKIEKDISYVQIKDPAQALKLDLYLPSPDALKAAGGDHPMPILVRLSPHRETPSRPAGELLGKGYALIYAAYLPDDAPRTQVFSRFPADLFAAKAAIRWVRGNAAKENLDPDRIGVWGAGHGATLAALLAMTADQKDLAGTLGDFPDQSAAVRCVCLFSGTTDWRYAELYGDETVNLPESGGSPAYQLFAGNPKEHTDDARRASAVTYIRPNSPPLLMVTLASDSNRAMHLIFAETLRRAGVPSALYEEPPGSGAGLGGRAVDEARLDRTVLEFFADTLAGKTAPANLSIDQEITQLASAGLYKQALRILEEQVAAAPTDAREPWLKKVREITEQQQAPARDELIAAIKKYNADHPAGSASAPRPTWTSREVLTDPEHIGEYHVVETPTNLEYDSRVNALRLAESLNELILQKDFAAADRQAANLRTAATAKTADANLINDFLGRYNVLRAQPNQPWPSHVKPVDFALASGRDLHGFWFTMRTAGGIIQRFRYIPPGNFAMGSAKSEWSRLPDEPILEPTEIKQGFWLADSPVTQETWEGVMGAAENRSEFKGPKLPVTNLGYADAIGFLEKLGVDARLPTSAEWEYACRAGSRDMYPVTGRLADSSWFWEEAKAPPVGGVIGPGATGTHTEMPEGRILSDLETDRTATPRSTHPVRQKLPNDWGLYDMQGNVWEWCAGTSPSKPRDYHMARGGSWISIPQSCRAARIAWFPIEEQSWNLGLRILIPAQSQ